MTESEWQACDDWKPMVEFLAGRWSKRKAILYLCAGLRELWDLLYHDLSREVVEIMEREADGAATQEEVGHASWDAEVPTFGGDFDPAQLDGEKDPANRSEAIRRSVEIGVYTQEDILAGREGDSLLARRLLNVAEIVYRLCIIEEGEFDELQIRHLTREEGWPRGSLVREIAGNPFRLDALEPDWTTPDVLAVASAAYQVRSLPGGHLEPFRLAVLSDALEEAGCTDAAILDHLRSPGPHVRGCWALDLILGKA